MNRNGARFGVFRLGFLLWLVAFAGLSEANAQSDGANEEQTVNQEQQAESYVNFRHIEPDPPKIDLNAAGPIRFLTDSSFPPYSYKTADGALTGFNVALADAMCKDLRLRCEFIVKPWEELLPSLEKGEGNAVLSGVRITKESFETLDFTRPFFRPFGKFVVRRGTPLNEPSARALAGKRIGVAAGSTHEAFLKAFFPRSRILPNESAAAIREALRLGQVDALFEDSVKAMFWLTGDQSRRCCRFLGGGFRDRVYLNSVLSIAVKQGNPILRDVLDHGLDRLQTSGQFIRIYRAFFPLDAW